MGPLCILHAGAEKTGSTSLQHFLRLNEAALAARRIWVPRALLADPADPAFNHTALSTASQISAGWPDDLQTAMGLQDVAGIEAHRAEVAARLAKERAGLGFTPEVIIVSSEHVHSRLREIEDVERAKTLLEPYCGAFKVVLYLRRQDDMARSLAALALRGYARAVRVIPDFSTPHGRDAVLHVDQDYFDFAEIIDRLAWGFGESAMTVRLYDPDGNGRFDTIDDFFGALGIDINALARPARQNGGISQTAGELLAYVNRILIGHPQRDLVRARVLAYVQAKLPGTLHRAPAGEAALFLRQFAFSNETVRRRWFPARGTLFAPVAEDVPRPEYVPLTDEAAAQLLAEILNHPIVEKM